jgi:pimeloyl-ACP methyl ester carboxylesterase
MAMLALAMNAGSAVAAGTAAAAASTGAPVDLLRPPGHFHEVEGVRVYLHCLGSGSPLVVIDAGIGASSLEWLDVQEAVATTTRVCAWDRPGYGWSDPGPAPRATPEIAHELQSLLDGAGETAPYVLVGHSFGGFTARYLAATQPARVVGMVLVESSAPTTEVAIDSAPQSAGRANPLVPIDDAATTGVPHSRADQAFFLNTRRKAIFTQMDELRHFHDSGQAVSSAGPLPPVPLKVLMRSQRVWPAGVDGDAAEQAWTAAQAALARMSPLGELQRVEGGGHSLHVDNPVAVADAIREVVAAARERMAQAADASNVEH